MLYFIIDIESDEELGQIECVDEDILDTLEAHDYISSADDCTLVPAPDGEWKVKEGRNTILFLANRGPDGEEFEDDEDEFDDVDEEGHENEDD